MHIHTHICTHMHTHTYTHVHMSTHAHMHTQNTHTDNNQAVHVLASSVYQSNIPAMVIEVTTVVVMEFKVLTALIYFLYITRH